MLAMDEYGTRRIRQWVNNCVEPALEHLGHVFKDIAQFTYTSQKVFRIVQPESGQTQGEIEQVSINIPMYNDFGEVVERFNDYSAAQFDIRIVAGATQPINRWALLDEYFKWYQSGLIDDIAMLEHTDIRNKKSILQRKSLYSQLQSQLESLTETLKDRESTIETLQRQVVQSEIQNRIDEGSREIDSQITKTIAQQKLLQQRMSDREKELSNKNVDNTE